MSKDTGSIREGSIAEFMRKRTQLVGFEFGLNKHTQFAVEFVDNALDAIESFQWKELKKYPETNAFGLHDEVLLENLSYLGGGITQEDIDRIEAERAAKPIDDEGHEMSEEGEITVPPPEIEPEKPEDKLIIDTSTPPEGQVAPAVEAPDDEEALKFRSLQKKEQDLEL